MSVCSYHVTYAFQSESTLHSCLNVKELLAHSETRTWHDKNIQSNAPYRKVLTTQLNYLASLAKWLSVRL